jgi:hypothetical protein
MVDYNRSDKEYIEASSRKRRILDVEKLIKDNQPFDKELLIATVSMQIGISKKTCLEYLNSLLLTKRIKEVNGKYVTYRQ